jgi:hypothetical protein
VRLASSFRDPSGFLFKLQGELFRQVNQIYATNYDQLIESGLYQSLTNDGLLIHHEDVTEDQAPSVGGYKVLRPEPLNFVSYPYEWSFTQLKDAALTTLNIQKRSLEFGMSLKDSSAYNIQFHKGQPLLVDTLSFESAVEGKPWVAYRQFCQHFLAPLALMALRDIRLANLLRIYIDGVPLDLASKLLPGRTRFNLSLQAHIHAHASVQKRFADTSHKTQSVEGRSMGKYGLIGIIENLEATIRKLNWSPGDTEWGDYYSLHGYDENTFDQKQSLVKEFLEPLQPQVVWDLGANTGLFSRIASDRGIPTIAFDIDPTAVEANYLECKRQSEMNMLPLLSDLTNPSPNLGWASEERTSLIGRGPADVVLALALIHHLAISNNVPLADLSSFFSKVGNWCIIEFVPKEDPQVQRLLISREDIFENYSLESFESAFTEHFHLRRQEQIGESMRTLFLFESRGV